MLLYASNNEICENMQNKISYFDILYDAIIYINLGYIRTDSVGKKYSNAVKSKS